MKIAFITGTTRGLGKALAETYKRALWQVVELSRPGFDLLNPDMRRIVHTDADDSVFINNASSLLVLQRFQDQQIVEELTKNLISQIRLIQRFIDEYPNGTVINITSGLARESFSHLDLYCVAKAGMEAYMRSLQCRGTRCINFDPGVVNTDMQTQLRSTNHPEQRRFVDYYKTGLLRDPREVSDRLYAEHQAVLTP